MFLQVPVYLTLLPPVLYCHILQKNLFRDLYRLPCLFSVILLHLVYLVRCRTSLGISENTLAQAFPSGFYIRYLDCPFLLLFCLSAVFVIFFLSQNSILHWACRYP